MNKALGRSAIWCALYIVLLFTLLTPLSFITSCFVMAPMLIVGASLPRLHSIGFLIVVLLVLLVAGGGLGIAFMIVTVAFTIPAAVMVYHYKKKSEAITAITAGTMTLLAVLLAALLLIHLSGINLNEQIREELEYSWSALPADYQEQLGEFSDLLIPMLIKTLPYMLVVISVFFVSIGHTVARNVLKQTDVVIPKFRRLVDWRLPRSFVWYYVIVLFADMFTNPESESWWAMVVWNGVPLFMTIFAAQAISFLAFATRNKGWGRVLPVLGVVLFPFLPQLISLIGVFDTAFPLRNRFKS
ncbi:DUF2232 domain-containing protein [Marinicrinis lubricantis]|uniref:DUF2232 domain-containing protein n=1 Tax=Marinicrinis lubricantis TaxID=2086470 RepID=A0ABW1IQR5_9BACL